MEHRLDGALKVLLTKRAVEPFKEHWCLPGGHIDWMESAADAAQREVQEEVGLHCEPKFLMAVNEIIPDRDWHAVVLVYSAEGKGALRLQQEEVAAVAWFEETEIREVPLAFNHREILDAFFEKIV